MTRIVIRIYDFFKKHSIVGWGVFVLVTALLVWSMLQLGYKEDISDFLPLDETNQTALSVYQDISGANNIYVIVSTKDTTNVDAEELANGVESFAGNVATADFLHFIKKLTKEVDMEAMMEIGNYVYDNIPYYLTEVDYARIDSLMQLPEYVDRCIEEDKQMLLFPSSNMLALNISRDPLNLFSPVAGRLRQGGMPISFETYDGYILSPDLKKAIIILESSYGSSESENNARLSEMLATAKAETEKENANLDIHIIGGPVIAVANAERIKKDSILAVSIAGILILTLLIYVFRNMRNILLIVVSVGWGWLFAIGIIALCYDSVSIIVIGIASVILGIAVNYPLHLIDHLKGSDHPKAALKEIVAPLVVGNVTTVGAFLCLVPLDAPALHDLGLFSSLLLIGTILFVLTFLPQVVKTRRRGEKEIDAKLISRVGNLKIENNRWVVWGVLALTLFFGYFSLRTEFDSDMRNINYMTPEQRQDMEYFSSLTDDKGGTEKLYIVSNGKNWDDALLQHEIIGRTIDSLQNVGYVQRVNKASCFFKSREEQIKGLELWKNFVRKYKDILHEELGVASERYGFSNEAFSSFNEILERDYELKDFKEQQEFLSTVFAGNLSEDDEHNRKSVVESLIVSSGNVEKVKDIISGNEAHTGIVFDVRSMNGSIANTLSNDFNYIGVACGCIVFSFLWLSLGRIELAIISFLPMAFSWIWILGIMGILGIKFNIVNVILATFIFGQGDDYTIFMTEGLTYELAYRKKLLASYKNSIIVSALIMFIGIGTLLFAKHPAMRSLGEVTVVGMLSVVLMSYLFPPLLFRWLTEKNGKLRRYPLTLMSILRMCVMKMRRGKACPEECIPSFDGYIREVYGRYIYKGPEIERKAKRMLRICTNRKKGIMDLGDYEKIVVSDGNGQGEMAVILSLMYPKTTVYCFIPDADTREILRGCIFDFCENLKVVDKIEEIEEEINDRIVKQTLIEV